MQAKTSRITLFLGLPGLMLACSKEVPPRTVSEFVENPFLLEATMVRCAQNRSQMKYDAECVNAREAANRLAASADAARRAELDAQSEQKRQALRRTQEAAAEARRRAAEAQRLREEAAYLGQFGQLPPGSNTPEGNTASTAPSAAGPAATPMPPGNAPGVQVIPEESSEADDAPDTPPDLDAIREELKRRQEGSQ
ncbi:MAG: EexN family lipoprotein [Gammaproteobacteria bacterium]|nr:EexN family lipoprotein [Gammaproteobacteria bacterium]MDH4314656.1 EexN family lipoprotein [Gammaproteobacteria bacterium]MDH5213397.1 EexN family lipoprotein [Gammaproteobacteria bacterium]